MSRIALLHFALVVLMAVPVVADAAPHPPTKEQMFYARREAQLETELARRHLTYSNAHPRIKKLQEEITRCKQMTTPRALAQARQEQQPRLVVLEQEFLIKQEALYEMRLKYTDNHPRLQAARHEVEQLSREIAMRRRK